MCLRAWGRNQLRQPFVGIILCHNSLPIEPVEPLVRLPSQGTQLPIGKTADRNRCPLMHPYISVTGRISGADIQHHPARVLPIDSVRRPIGNAPAAIRAFHRGIIDSLSFLSFQFHPFFQTKNRSVAKRKKQSHPTGQIRMDYSAIYCLATDALEHEVALLEKLQYAFP